MRTITLLLSLILTLFICTPAYALVSNIVEEDGSPSGFPWKVKFPNASLTDNGDGTFSYAAAGGGGETLAQTLALGADANDVDTTSWGKMEGFDAGLYLDWDADGVIDFTSDGTLELHSSDWDISTTGVQTNMGNITSDGTIEGATLTEGGNAVLNATELEGTAILSTGEGGASKFLREDGDGTSSWQAPAGSGDLLADASVPMTANWDIGNFDITLKSLIASDNAEIGVRTYVPGTSATTGQGYFTGTTGTPLSGFQALDLGGKTYTFFANNKYYTGSGWADLGQARVGSAFQIIDDAFKFYSFDTAATFTQRFTVAAGGNVGVGPDATPDYLLDVQGTLEGATLTEGGNAVYNATETPGGSLGNTWASPTIDDLFLKLGGDAASAGTYDFGAASVVLEIPNAAAPTTDATGEMAIDTDLITQGMLQVYLASAIANVVATTDSPGDNEVPVYDSGGGTVQWEAPAGGGGENLAATLALGADANDVDTTSWGKMEGFDAGLYLDWDADGVINLTSDGTLELHSADWDIGATGIATGMGNITSDGTIEGATLTEGGVAVSNDNQIEAVVEPLIDTLANLASAGGQPVAFADAGTDAFWGWDDAGGAQYENLTAAEAMTIIGGAATDLDANGAVAWGNITAGELADNTVDSDDFVHEDWGEVTNASGSVVIDDSIAVTSWNLTTPVITTSIDLPAGAINTATEIAADIITHAQIADADQATSITLWFEDPTADDDFKSIWANKTANDFLITEIWGESDQTVSFDLQVDDGSPADVSGTDIAPAAGEAEDTTLAGDTTLAAGEELDLAITSVSGTPTWVSITFTGNWVD